MDDQACKVIISDAWLRFIIFTTLFQSAKTVIIEKAVNKLRWIYYTFPNMNSLGTLLVLAHQNISDLLSNSSLSPVRLGVDFVLPLSQQEEEEEQAGAELYQAQISLS